MDVGTLSTDRPRTSVGRRGRSSFAGAPESLRAVAGRVLNHLHDGRRALIDAYFQVGDEIHKLRTSTAFGRRAVALLAQELGMDESGLQRWGRLAEMIRGEERDAICGATDRFGLPITPSLLVELERVRDRTIRMKLARTVLEKGQSVRQLRAVVTELNKRRSPNAPLR
jgi:hypothetical protein